MNISISRTDDYNNWLLPMTPRAQLSCAVRYGFSGINYLNNY